MVVVVLFSPVEIILGFLVDACDFARSKYSCSTKPDAARSKRTGITVSNVIGVLCGEDFPNTCGSGNEGCDQLLQIQQCCADFSRCNEGNGGGVAT